MRTVVILVHFGTANKEAIKNSIFKLEEEVENNTGFNVINAFMLKRISTILKNKENIDIAYFEEVLARVNTKFERIIIQPVYLIDGEEYKKIEKIVDAFKNESLAKVDLRKPLIYGKKIEQEILCQRLVESIKEDIILQEKSNGKEEIELFIGHGSDKLDNNQYEVLEKSFKKVSKDSVVGTLMGIHDKAYVKEFLIKNDIKKARIHLLFMLIGKHVRLDVLGTTNSWISMLNDVGIEVEIIDKSLLEYEAIRKIFIGEITQGF